MRSRAVFGLVAVLLASCASDSFSGNHDGSEAGLPDAGRVDAGNADVAQPDGGSDGASPAVVAVRDFNTSSGSVAVGTDTSIGLTLPGGAAPSDVVFAVIALYPLSSSDPSTIVPPAGWVPTGAYFNNLNGANFNSYWHAFAFATALATPPAGTTFVVRNFGGTSASRWHSALVAYSGTALASVDFKAINNQGGSAVITFPAVIVAKNGSHVFTGFLGENPLPMPLLGLPGDTTETGSGFMNGLGRFLDQPKPMAGAFPAFTIPTGPDGGALALASTTFQFVVAPAN